MVAVKNILGAPNRMRENASLQKFAKITPQYPGVRAPLENGIAESWLSELGPMLAEHFDPEVKRWAMQAWYSIVTTPAEQLLPLQCFPHVDGTDPRQLAMMLYLHETDHGGTGFFRHLSTGYESLNDKTFPDYRDALQADVQKTGLPAPAYPTDGAPHFERVFASEGAFNQAIFYRGNILHSGVIEPGAELSSDPMKGRLTINAFFRPI